jgi:hypothetical protein
MPDPKERYEGMLAERVAEAAEADRARLWYAVRTVLYCIGCQLVGGALFVYSLHGLMPPDEAQAFLAGGVGIATGGTLLTVFVRHGER